ncbi:membrane lipoprotein lipid attachment site-containing protein [Klebsiella pneumoniae]|nr:membrane lipoprotein lipid attachment site-containing protein [Klebsiella pneumoniae]
MKKSLVVFSIVLALTGCAGKQVSLNKPTQSGKPEGLYPGKTKAEVENAIVSLCNSKGFTVFSADESSVVCGKEKSGTDAVLTQVLIGNSYSTPPTDKVRFSIAKINNDVKVWVDMWAETQMPGGQVNHVNYTDNASKNAAQQGLDNLKP